jgi:hypothetical protein
MMPPKVKQIADFVMETERALSGFSLDAMAMRGRLPALRGIIKQLAQAALETQDKELQETQDKELQETQDKELQGCLATLEIKARKCRDCIERRLLIKS